MKKILAIDDQKNSLITIEAIITSNIPDCKALTALSGKEGIKIASEEQPDIILLDIVMPEMDGFEVCKKLKEDKITKHIPVLMLSAIKTDTKSRVKALDVGADAFLQKPIDSAELTAQVNVMMRIKAAEDKLHSEKEQLDEIVNSRTKELRESERQLQAIFDDPNTFIGLLELDGSLIKANKAALKFIDSSNSELRGDKFWLTPWWTHSKELQEKLKLGIIEAGKGGIVMFEADHFGYDGRQIFVNFSIRPVKDLHDKIYKLIVEGIDITYRKHMEETLRQYEHIVSGSTDMLALLDTRFKYLAANKAYMEVFNLSPDQLIGKTVANVFGEEFFNTVIKPNADLCMSGEEINYQDWFDFPNHGRRFMDVIYYPYYSENNKIMGYVVNGRNITERKKAEQELKESEKRLRELNISKDKFFAIIGHDLINPFGLVMSAAEELSKDYDIYDEEDRKLLIEIISKDSKHAMNLLQNLLQWSRSQRGLIEYNPEIFFIKEVIDENIKLLKENAKIKQIKLRSNIPPTIIVYADKNMISTIIRNLLSNAIKFSENGTILFSYEIKDGQLHVSVVDSGTGIEKQLLDKLFKIYEGISNVGTSGEHGTGLGLNLCKEFITKNKGEIWVESKVGKGSKFTFSVPMKP